MTQSIVKNALTVGVLALAATGMANAATVAVDGGASWGGWDSVGLSNALGVYANGSTTAEYEVYTTAFAFESGMAGTLGGVGTGAAALGAFSAGNTILGIGVRRISGEALLTPSTRTVRFDLNGSSFTAATSVAAQNGVTGTATLNQGEFTTQFEASNNWRASNLAVCTAASNCGVSNLPGGGGRLHTTSPSARWG